MDNETTAATRPIYYTPPAALRAENEKAAGLRGCGRTVARAAFAALCGAALFVVAGIITRLILEALR